MRAPLFAALFLALLCPLCAADEKKLNVLFLIADDLNCDLGCYGHPEMKTPSIDALAARSIRFDRAYCQYPLCSPSRSSFLTGRRPNVTGVLTNPSAKTPVSPHFREKIPDTVTLPQLFKKNGWFAARVGKLYHYGVPNDIGTGSLDDFQSWDLAINPRGLDREIHDKIFSLEKGQFGGTLSWLAAPGEDREHTDGIGAEEAISLLKRFKDEARPFFLAVGFYRPHTPYVSPKKWFDAYPPDAIALPESSADDKARTPAPAYGSAKKEQEKMTDAQRREAIQAYHAAISFMDAQVGRVVGALDRLGLAENTVIVFTSDHGYHLGDHGLWQKMSLFDRSLRVPLIIAKPAAKAHDQSAAGLVELLDIYPTLAELAGLKTPDYIEGTSLAPMLDDPSKSVKTAAFSQVRRGPNLDGYTVRSGKWRYTEWDGGAKGAQLFDEESDPREARNLAADPTHAQTVAEMKKLLEGVKAKP
jgi:arylsulfatase A-like enzyme